MQISLAGYGPGDPKERARASLARIEREARQREHERREDRKKGKVSQSLREKLRSCTPDQLKKVKKICEQYIKDHRRPPNLQEISNSRNATILRYIGIKNRMYLFEVHPCSKPNCKKCPHGPYVYVHHRDGRYIRARYVKDKSQLPRKVQAAFRSTQAEYRARPLEEVMRPAS